MPLATTYLVNEQPRKYILHAANCLRKNLKGVRVTISREGNIKVHALTRRAISDVQKAAAKLEKRCKL